MLIYTPLNSKAIVIGPVTSAITGALITNATVSATLYTGSATGTPVAGATDIALTHQGEGVYRGTITGSAFNPPTTTNYVTVFSLSTPDGNSATWTIPSLVQNRTS